MGPITSAIRRLAALALFGAGFIETQRDDADLKHTVRSADSLASATALLGRPVFMPWTLIPETDPAFPFRPLFAELRRNINLLRQCDDGHEGFLDCREVVRYVLDEDSEIVRASPFDDTVPLDTRGSGAQLYRLPCILVIGMPGGIAEKTLATIINYFASVGWDLPRLFFVPIGSMQLAEATIMQESLAYDRVFSCFESEPMENVVDYCKSLASDITGRGAPVWGRKGAFTFFWQNSGRPEFIAALSSSIVDAWFELSGDRRGFHEMHAALPAPVPHVIPMLYERPTATVHQQDFETRGSQTASRRGLFSSVSCCDAEGVLEIVDTDESHDYVLVPPMKFWGRLRVRSRPYPGASSCHLTVPFGIIHRNFDVRCASPIRLSRARCRFACSWQPLLRTMPGMPGLLFNSGPKASPPAWFLFAGHGFCSLRA